MSFLQSKRQDAENDSDTLDYQNRVCEIAAIARATFDVDPCHLSELLVTPKDLAEFIKCGIALHDNQPTDPGSATLSLQTLLCRDNRLSHRALPLVLEILRSNNRTLCTPMVEIWSHYRPGPTGWRALKTPNNRWVSTSTAAGNRRDPQRVHLNLLQGQLLIDGKPLGRLPQGYVKDPVYIRLFGQVRLNLNIYRIR